MTDGPVEQRFVGYPRVQAVSDTADRMQALAYALVGFTCLVILSCCPILVLPADGLRHGGLAGMAAIALFALASTVVTFKCYSLLLKGQGLSPHLALWPTLVYFAGFLQMMLRVGHAGLTILFVESCSVSVVGAHLTQRALARYRLPYGLFDLRRLHRAVEERRIADQAAYAPPIPENLLSGDPPKQSA